MRFHSTAALLLFLALAAMVHGDEGRATQADGKQSKAADSKPARPVWQPMLAKSFQADVKDLRASGLVVDGSVGCVFLNFKGKGVFCSSAGAGRFTSYGKTWEQVCQLHAGDIKRRFVLSGSGIKESKDDGATWSKPFSLPEGFVVTEQTWLAHDAKHDVLYLMKPGSDLYKLARGKVTGPSGQLIVTRHSMHKAGIANLDRRPAPVSKRGLAPLPASNTPRIQHS